MEETKIVNVTERGNSFCGRYEGVGTDFKIKFDTEKELIDGLKAVQVGREFLASLEAPENGN